MAVELHLSHTSRVTAARQVWPSAVRAGNAVYLDTVLSNHPVELHLSHTSGVTAARQVWPSAVRAGDLTVKYLKMCKCLQRIDIENACLSVIKEFMRGLI